MCFYCRAKVYFKLTVFPVFTAYLNTRCEVGFSLQDCYWLSDAGTWQATLDACESQDSTLALLDGLNMTRDLLER